MFAFSLKYSTVLYRREVWKVSSWNAKHKTCSPKKPSLVDFNKWDPYAVHVYGAHFLLIQKMRPATFWDLLSKKSVSPGTSDLQVR